MYTIEEHINIVNTKLQVLLKKYASLQKENEILTSHIEKFKQDEIELSEKINLLELQTGIIKASAGAMNEADKFEFEKRINQYIKELDKCMAMLNN